MKKKRSWTGWATFYEGVRTDDFRVFPSKFTKRQAEDMLERWGVDNEELIRIRITEV